jgi:hypothetical protein
MTAFDLIDSIYARAGWGVEGNTRRITRRQMSKLIELIGEDKQGGDLRRGTGSSLVWMPSGRDKYVITEDLRGERHTLTRLPSIAIGSMGSLF